MDGWMMLVRERGSTRKRDLFESHHPRFQEGAVNNIHYASLS